MSIWIYSDTARALNPEIVWLKQCPYCGVPLARLKTIAIREQGGLGRDVLPELCQACGWWKAIEIQRSWNAAFTALASATLKNLDLSDISTPIENVRSFLCAKFSDRFHLHPRLFEETVASVFCDFGYDTEVTAYSGDDGIDVILRKDTEQVGVQVKRYRNSIAVEKIRELAGALVLNGMTKGIFITTSTFQRGAERTTRRLEQKGYAIELVDAPRFLEALKVAQRTRYEANEGLAFDHTQMRFFRMDEVLNPEEWTTMTWGPVGGESSGID